MLIFKDGKRYFKIVKSVIKIPFFNVNFRYYRERTHQLVYDPDHAADLASSAKC